MVTATSAPATAESDTAYCLEQVRRFNRDRYLAALFARSGPRADLMALYAFNLELAKIREVVREPMMGLIRLQWWRDCIAEVHGGKVRRHQVAQPLAAAAARHGLPRESFDRLIDAREADMDVAPPADLAALRAYAESTGGTLQELAVRIVMDSGRATDPALSAARDLGTAWALIGLVRAIPFHARAKRVYVPQALMAEAGVAVDDLFELRPGPGFATAVGRICGEAGRLMAKAQAALPEPPRAAFPVFLMAVLARRHLASLAAAGFDTFDRRVADQPPATPWPLAVAWLRGKVW
jgi:NADH dehydrogenase [ubiquinone] 1 alpha subcomplex assembly factor 6